MIVNRCKSSDLNRKSRKCLNLYLKRDQLLKIKCKALVFQKGVMLNSLNLNDLAKPFLLKKKKHH